MNALAALRQSSRAALCAECGKCTAVCPLAACGGFAARQFACQHLEEEVQGLGLGVRRCLTCAACEQRCPQGVRFTDLVRGLRGLTLGQESPPECPHGGALLSLMRIMARGDAAQDRLGWLGDGLKTVPDKGEVFLWTGCAAYYDAFFPELGISSVAAARASVRVLNRLGIVPVVSPQERCCGHDLLWNGDRPSFELLARHNAGLVAASGARTLVTPCAECLRTWKLDYEPFLAGGAPLRIAHLSELVAERLPELKWRPNGRRRLTFQDPCRLGRHLGIYEPPRQVLEALPGVEVAEMGRAGRTARCCAGGNWSHCDRFSKRIQVDRLGEARGTGAQVLVTACPKCRIHLRCAMRDPDGGAAAIEIQDWSEVVDAALE